MITLTSEEKALREEWLYFTIKHAVKPSSQLRVLSQLITELKAKQKRMEELKVKQ